MRDASQTDGQPVDTGDGFRWVTPLDAPASSGVFAFLIGNDGVEYLGPARLDAAGDPLLVPELRATNQQAASDDVYVVSGWLTRDLPAPCPPPLPLFETPKPATEYLCGGTWLTPMSELNEINNGSGRLGYDDGIQVQSSALDQFLTTTGSTPGSVPAQGVYLVRNAGCPPIAQFGCPVWRMVGRLDSSATAPTPTPSPTAPSAKSAIPIASAQALSNLIGDPDWIGKTVLAEVQIDAARPVGCTTGITCPLGLIDGVSGPNSVLVGWRDATADDGVQYDDGNGYRWVKQLELPTESGLFAFTVGQDAVEYLGPAYLTPDGDPVTVADLQGVSNTLPIRWRHRVGGWLAKNWPPPPCAAPPEMLESPPPALDYYCYGTWIIPSETASLDAGVRAQNDAYEMFAPSPFQDEHGVKPQQGVYLVRNAGCPIEAPCPAWRMVGRVDGGSAGPTNTPAPAESLSPAPSPTITPAPTGSSRRRSVRRP